MANNTNQKLEKVQIQIQQLKNQEKQLLQKQKEDARKERTKRLIERGAILESLIPNADTFTNEQIKWFLEKTLKNDHAHKILGKMTAAVATTSTPDSSVTQKPKGKAASNGKVVSAAPGTS